MCVSVDSRYSRLLFCACLIYFTAALVVNAKQKPAILNRTEVISERFRKLAEDGKLRTILLWTTFYDDDAFMFGFGEEPFVGENRCPIDDCLVTKNRTFMDIEDYDVIVYHMWGKIGVFEPPKRRNPKQYYAFASLENPDYFLIDNYSVLGQLPKKDFFNWTITYRQDSDFHWAYYRIVDLYNASRIIAPAKNPEWIDHNDKKVDAEKTLPTLNKKHKKAAWFASRCPTKNRREDYVAELQKYIQVDVYGKCGTLHCIRNDTDDQCHEMLQTDYYFYLAFENADCFDYISEKATHPLQHDVIPIVFGTANYTQHLPPHSYINAKEYKPRELAEVMERIIANQTEYAHYFWWKDHYKIHNIGISIVNALPYLHPFCEICKALHEANLPAKRYEDINAWWVGNKTHPTCTH